MKTPAKVEVSDLQLSRLNFLRERAGAAPVDKEQAAILLQRLSRVALEWTHDRIGHPDEQL